MQGLDAAGFVECTPIQAQTLPIGLEGRDIAGQAQTGTGKTAAFLISTFTMLLRNEPPEQGKISCPRALIIAPTRELAMQIYDEALLLGKFTGLKMHAVYGGVDYVKQMETLADGVDILIGTPGRLIDYFKQKVYSLRETEVFIADEADRMFDMGFIDDLRFLIRRMPPADKRTSFLYSATLSMRVMELAFEHMHDATRVAIDETQVTAERVDQILYHVGQEDKFPLLLGVLKAEAPERALIFVNTRGGAANLAERLQDEGFNADALIGNLPQKKRTRMLQDFKDHKIALLVATDVASRGLHIDEVTHVFNYDLPQDPEDYVHRIGRTARAGASGKAVSLACEKYVYSLEPIEEFVGKSLPSEFADPEMLVQPTAPRRRRRPSDDRGRGGKGGPRGGGGGGGGGRGGSGRSRSQSSGDAGSGDGGSGGSSGDSDRRDGDSQAASGQNSSEGGDGAKNKRRRRRPRGSRPDSDAPAPAEG